MRKNIGLALLLMVSLSGCGPSEKERERAQEQNERSAMDSCKSTMTSNIERSCRADPDFTYCSLNYDRSEIIGSGCTRRIKNLPYSEQAEFCIKESIRTVGRACAIEVYGCTAVTGDINC